MRGIVKFYKESASWGAITSDGVDGDVFFHLSAVGNPRPIRINAGNVVEFEYEKGQQDSFSYRATSVMVIEQGTSHVLRREGDKVKIRPMGTLDTPEQSKK